jgi:pyruvate/2-oxoglutarate dehydrogenase complex dihydrolipoamide acyltransferase (E2) component
MPREVIMPALGMAQDTGHLVSWRKAPGDAVSVGDVLFEVETDKATMEVEAQADGFLTHVTAQAGQDVPVGQVIAQISATADAPGPSPAPASVAVASADALPEGQHVIMPALGMAQDTGLLVTWLKAPGDAVTADDILFEVETDKSTVEVNAGHDGYVAALLALEGENIPTGQTIAIISAEKPAKLVSRSFLAATAPQAAPVPEAAPSEAAAPQPKTAPAPQPMVGGRILASPKARRLALEQGLDLSRLVAAGHPQPYHASDIEVLRALPVAASQGTGSSLARRLTAQVPQDGFDAFARWVAEDANLDDSDALLAGFAAASLGRGPVVVGVEAFDRERTFATDGALASVQATSQGVPDLILRDLRFTRLVTLALGAEDQPVLTLTRSGEGLAITLECAPHHLSAPQALRLLSEFAGRMEQPLRHLL